MTVKEIINVLADCPPEAVVSVAINSGVQLKILPANNLQILINEVDGRKIHNFMLIATETKS